MRRIGIVVIALMLVLPTSGVAQPATPTGDDVALGFTLGFDGMGMRTDGRTIIWTEQTIGGAPSFAPYNTIAYARVDEWIRHELKRGPQESESTGSVVFGYPDVSGDIATWVETGALTPASEINPERRIVAYNLATAMEVALAATGPAVEFWSPRVVGDYIAWVEHRGLTQRIIVRDATGSADPIVVATTDETDDWHFAPYLENLVIDDGTIYWGEQIGDAWRLWAYRPGVDASPRMLIERADLLLAPGAFDVWGGRIVVRVLTTPANTYIDRARVVLGDVNYGGSGEVIDLPLPVATWNGNVSSLEVSGRYIFATVNDPFGPPGSNCCHMLVSAFDTGVNAAFTLIDSRNVSIDVADDVLVWSSGHSLGGFTYMAGPLAGHLPSAPVADTRLPDPDWTFFPETGHYLQHGFKTYWERNGGLPIFGYPLTEEYLVRGADTAWSPAQMTERQRFEWHSENAGTPYEVLLGRLGAELLEWQGDDWTTFPTADATTPHYMPETGHAIAPEFWDYWSSHGLDLGDPGISFRESLALFGYPLTEPMIETNADGDRVLTQYFERAVFEYHPDDPAEWQVLLRRLGAEVLRNQGWN